MKKKQGLHFDTKRFPGKRCKRRAVRHAFALTAALVLAGLCAGCSRAGTWEMHVREELLRVEGLEGEYTLLFLTDTHMVVMDDPVRTGKKQRALEQPGSDRSR